METLFDILYQGKFIGTQVHTQHVVMLIINIDFRLLEIPRKWNLFSIGHCSLSLIVVHDDGTFKIHSIGGISHLKDQV